MLTRIRERLRIILGRITLQGAQQSTSLSEDGLGENTGTLKQELEERRMKAPDGQVLPDWMSYVTVSPHNCMRWARLLTSRFSMCRSLMEYR